MGQTFTLLPQVESTNALVMEWGKQQKPQGAGCLAFCQTAGRGRLGRTFFSPEGSGLYFSLLLRPAVTAQTGLAITTAAAVAMAKALEAQGKQPMIKWVNDILLDNRKVCGILAQSGFSGGSITPDFVVLGVGLNLCPPTEGFPCELQEVAGGVFEELPSPQTAVSLVQDFLRFFWAYYARLEEKDHLTHYQSRNWLLGKTVTAGAITGRVQGVDSAFRLLVQGEDGEIHPIAAGEVTLGTKNLV